MSDYHLLLEFTPVGKWVCLREIRGSDVMKIDQTGTLDAIRLLDNLLVDRSETSIQPGMAAAITIADRDELLSVVYRKTFGNKIESTINCQSCKEAFDLNFKVDQLLDFIKQKREITEVEKQEDGTYKLPDGSRFRLPSGEDERTLLGLPKKQARKVLLERCLIEGDIKEKATEIQIAMGQIAPVFETDLEANCPECNHSQSVHFDMQPYLLHALLLEKEQLPYEVHKLAINYGWSHQEILDLPRSLRQRYVSYNTT